MNVFRFPAIDEEEKTEEYYLAASSGKKAASSGEKAASPGEKAGIEAKSSPVIDVSIFSKKLSAAAASDAPMHGNNVFTAAFDAAAASDAAASRAAALVSKKKEKYEKLLEQCRKKEVEYKILRDKYTINGVLVFHPIKQSVHFNTVKDDFDKVCQSRDKALEQYHASTAHYEGRSYFHSDVTTPVTTPTDIDPTIISLVDSLRSARAEIGIKRAQLSIAIKEEDHKNFVKFTLEVERIESEINGNCIRIKKQLQVLHSMFHHEIGAIYTSYCKHIQYVKEIYPKNFNKWLDPLNPISVQEMSILLLVQLIRCMGIISTFVDKDIDYNNEMKKLRIIYGYQDLESVRFDKCIFFEYASVFLHYYFSITGLYPNYVLDRLMMQRLVTEICDVRYNLKTTPDKKYEMEPKVKEHFRILLLRLSIFETNQVDPFDMSFFIRDERDRYPPLVKPFRSTFTSKNLSEALNSIKGGKKYKRKTRRIRR